MTLLVLQPKEFDIVLDIKTRNVLYRDPISNKELEEIEVIQGDYKTNQLNIYLENGGRPYDIGENIVSIIFKLHDGTIISIDDNELIVENNIIQTILPTNVLTIEGRQVYGEVIVWGKNGERLTSTATFEFWIKQGILADETIESSNELPILSMLMEQVRTLEEDIVYSFTEVDGELKATITSAYDIHNILADEDGTIKQAEYINEALSNEVNGSIKRAESINAILTDEITGTIKTAEDIKDDLNVSITNAETINNTLSDEDGTIDLANDIHNKLTDINTGAIALAHEINDILTDEETGTIQQAEDANEELLDTIFEGGQVFEDVNTLKNIRIHYGEDEPDNTPFWYDTSDTTEIERRVV